MYTRYDHICFDSKMFVRSGTISFKLSFPGGVVGGLLAGAFFIIPGAMLDCKKADSILTSRRHILVIV